MSSRINFDNFCRTSPEYEGTFTGVKIEKYASPSAAYTYNGNGIGSSSYTTEDEPPEHNKRPISSNPEEKEMPLVYF